jgi:hypothetical protein
VLRADVASGVVVSATDERALDDLATRRVHLGDEARRLDARLVTPAPPPGPHDHLRHRRLPVPTATTTRRRLLAVWAAVSTPLILGAIGLAFLPARNRSITSALVVWVGVLLAVEALARRSLARLVLTVVALAAIVILVTTLAGLTVFFGWQVTVAVCFGALALALLVANLAELTRD